MFDGIIFDFDGTLADTSHIYADVCVVLARRYDFQEPTKQELERMREMTLAQKLRFFKVPSYRLPRLVREAMVLYSQLIETAAPYPGIKALVQYLAEENKNFYIVSSNSQETIQHFLTIHEMDQFTRIEGQASLFGKHLTLRKLILQEKLANQSLLYLGDEIRDIHACRKVGLPVGAVTWGYESKTILVKADPDYIFDQPADVLALLRNREQLGVFREDLVQNSDDLQFVCGAGINHRLPGNEPDCAKRPCPRRPDASPCIDRSG